MHAGSSQKTGVYLAGVGRTTGYTVYRPTVGREARRQNRWYYERVGRYRWEAHPFTAVEEQSVPQLESALGIIDYCQDCWSCQLTFYTPLW
jgi:hypothetical protein